MRCWDDLLLAAFLCCLVDRIGISSVLSPGDRDLRESDCDSGVSFFYRTFAVGDGAAGRSQRRGYFPPSGVVAPLDP